MVSKVNKSRPDAYVRDIKWEKQKLSVLEEASTMAPSHSDCQAEQCAGPSKLIFRSQDDMIAHP